MKTNIIRAILILLLLGTFFIIFGFSNQNGEESGGVSRKVTEALTKNIKSIQEMEQNQKENTLHKIEKVVRKLAHFSIYTIVGILLITLFTTYPLAQRKRVLSSLLIGILYATSDEIHQAFVPGRGPQITDVMIDSLGVIFGIIIVFALLKVYDKIKESYIQVT